MKCVQTIIEEAFIKIKKYDTLESNSLSPMESPLWAQRVDVREYTSAKGTRAEKTQGVASLFYGLETMNVASLCGRTSLTTKVRVWSLGMVLGRCWAPKTTRPIGRLQLIVSYILILLKAHSTLHLHTRTHTLAYI